MTPSNRYYFICRPARLPRDPKLTSFSLFIDPPTSTQLRLRSSHHLPIPPPSDFYALRLRSFTRFYSGQCPMGFLFELSKVYYGCLYEGLSITNSPRLSSRPTERERTKGYLQEDRPTAIGGGFHLETCVRAGRRYVRVRESGVLITPFSFAGFIILGGGQVQVPL